MARLSAEDAGTRAFDTICLWPGGLNRKMWRLYADITEPQLARGLDWLRDLLEQEPVIRIWVGGEWIYKLAVLERDALEHVERMLRTQITRVRREHNLLHGIAEKHPTADNRYQEELARRRLIDLQYAHDRLVGQEQIPA